MEALRAFMLADERKLAFYAPMHVHTVRNGLYAVKHSTILALSSLFCLRCEIVQASCFPNVCFGSNVTEEEMFNLNSCLAVLTTADKSAVLAYHNR